MRLPLTAALLALFPSSQAAEEQSVFYKGFTEIHMNGSLLHIYSAGYPRPLSIDPACEALQAKNCDLTCELTIQVVLYHTVRSQF